MTTLHELYYSAVTADDTWHAELVREYGAKACNARYDTKLNGATSALRTLRDAYHKASEACHTAAIASR
jgi:hypothetical protein